MHTEPPKYAVKNLLRSFGGIHWAVKWCMDGQHMLCIDSMATAKHRDGSHNKASEWKSSNKNYQNGNLNSNLSITSEKQKPKTTYANKTLNKTQSCQPIDAQIRGIWHKEAQHTRDEIGETKHELSAIFLRENTAWQLQKPVQPEKWAEYFALIDLVPSEFGWIDECFLRNSDFVIVFEHKSFDIKIIQAVWAG